MKTLVKVDKNGTKIYHDDRCHRCGGAGASDAWKFTGSTCYECGGSGRSRVRVEKEYTPEYRAILDARAKARSDKKDEERMIERTAKADQLNIEFLRKNFFGGNIISVIKGDTFRIKDELKEEGCTYRNGLGWYGADSERDSFRVLVNDLIQYDECGVMEMKAVSVLESIINDLKKAEQKESNYQGSIGQRLTLKVTVTRSIGFEVRSFTGYGTDMMYINKMEDANGNVFIWKTGTSLEEGEITIKGTVKDHSEYDGVKQTVLTRCKVQ